MESLGDLYESRLLSIQDKRILYYNFCKCTLSDADDEISKFFINQKSFRIFLFIEILATIYYIHFDLSLDFSFSYKSLLIHLEQFMVNLLTIHNINKRWNYDLSFKEKLGRMHKPNKCNDGSSRLTLLQVCDYSLYIFIDYDSYPLFITGFTKSNVQ